MTEDELDLHYKLFSTIVPVLASRGRQRGLTGLPPTGARSRVEETRARERVVETRHREGR